MPVAVSKVVKEEAKCPKCGSLMLNGHCTLCKYSKEGALTAMEAREFTTAG